MKALSLLCVDSDFSDECATTSINQIKSVLNLSLNYDLGSKPVAEKKKKKTAEPIWSKSMKYGWLGLFKLHVN